MVKINASSVFSFARLYLPEPSDLLRLALADGSEVRFDGPAGSMVLGGEFQRFSTDDKISAITFLDSEGTPVVRLTDPGTTYLAGGTKIDEPVSYGGYFPPVTDPDPVVIGGWSGLTESNIVKAFTGARDQVLRNLLDEDDSAWLSGQADCFNGFDGADTVFGKAGRDVLRGGADMDKLFGGAGADRLSGNHGNDRLAGNGGRDWLDGGRGSDILIGGNGDDVFVFTPGSSRIGQHRDVVRDFGKGADRIDLSAMLDEDARFIGGDRFSGEGTEISYRDGVLWVDSDGDGRADLSVRIAHAAPVELGDLIL